MREVGTGSLRISAVGLGCMAMSAYYGNAGGDDPGAVRAVHHALDLGITHLDTAEIYGPLTNEELLGRALRGRRDEVVLATKFGQLTHTGTPVAPGADLAGLRTRDSRPENVRAAVEGSLRRLRTDRIDLYYQHWPDTGTPIEDTMGALAGLVERGSVVGVGLSNADPEVIRRAHAVHPVAAVQVEYSLLCRDPEIELLPVLRELGIGLICYSPLAQGVLSGRVPPGAQLARDDVRRGLGRFSDREWPRNAGVVSAVESVARELGATAAQVALAWLLAQGDDVAVIPGARSRGRVEENAGAAELRLGPDHLARLAAATGSNDEMTHDRGGRS